MTTTGEPPRLITIQGPMLGEVFVVDADELVLGRDGASGVTIGDPSLSRKHCAIARGVAGWIVRDLGSFNGTFVNGEQVSERLLAHADRIRIGATELLFHAEHVSAQSGPASAQLPQTTRLRLDESMYLRGASVPQHESAPRDLLGLVRVATVVGGIRDRGSLERELLEAAFEATDASEAAFVRIDPHTSERSIVQSRTRSAGSPLAPDETVLDLAVSTREAILTSGPAGEPPLESASDAAGSSVSSVLAVPVFDDDLIAGVLLLITFDPARTFARPHLELVTAIAGLGSLALKNISRLESLLAETDRLKERLGIRHQMIGTSAAMQRVYDFIEKVSRSESTVLITGETGTGKELAARALHDNSPRAARPFVAINCAALTESLLESELFGHERGAFTNAYATKRGRLEVAHLGTLFLDEVGELSPALQAKLLRVLQFREFERVGGTRPIKVDVRLISATNRDLAEEVAAGRFRQDLVFRLKVLDVEMPPLRDRRQDIPALAQHFAALVAGKGGRANITFPAAAMRRLIAYDWPGNVRELENAIERAVVLSSTSEIEPDALPEAVSEGATVSGADGESRFHAAVTGFKRRLVLDAIEQANGRWIEAARLLGLHPNYVHRLRRTLKLLD